MRLSPPLAACLLVLTTPVTAAPSRVLEILGSGTKLRVSLDSAKPFKASQVVCVERDFKRIACGLVVSVNETEAVVSLDFRNSAPKVSDEVFDAGRSAKARVPDRPEMAHVSYRAPFNPRNHLSLLPTHDLDVYTFSLLLEHSWNGRVFYGLQFGMYDFFDRRPNQSGMGLHLVRSFLSSRSAIALALRIGIGAWMMNVTSNGGTGSVVSFSGYVTTGIRFPIFHGHVYFTPLAGLQYWTRPDVGGSYPTPFAALRANFGFELGFAL